MSTIRSYAVQCAVCGNYSEQTHIMSYTSFGYPDLDFRPPSMYRETMEFWVQECPHCGYVNTHLSDPTDLLHEDLLKIYREIETKFNWEVETEPYVIRLAKLKRPNMFVVWKHPKAVRFAKLGEMFSQLNQYDDAAEQFLRVAWVFDDDQNEQAATYWRKEAIWHIVWQLRDIITMEKRICIYADMLRRTGDFQWLLQLDEYQLKEEIYIQLFNYQRELSMREDSAAHKISEIGNVCKEEGKYSGGMTFGI